MEQSDFDARTSCTKDEAIAIMLGLGHPRIIEDDDINDPYEFDILDYLYEECESREGEFNEAGINKLGSDAIEGNLNKFA